MKINIEILNKTKLFSGIPECQLTAMLECLGANLQSYRKGGYIFHQGDFVQKLGILTEGQLIIQSDDYLGNRSIVNRIGAGEMFGEAYIDQNSGPVLNDVYVSEDSTVLFLEYKKILKPCVKACAAHQTLIMNLFSVVSEKNRLLVQKISHISKRTTREKLISYLSEQAKKNGKNKFTIPFSRQQLADYLAVDRSAMSAELSRMRNDGLLSFSKNSFSLLGKSNFNG